MAKVVVKSKIKKVKRKYPVEVKAPEYLNSYTLGKSEVTDLSSLVGKTAKVNLMYITGNVKNQNIRLTFRINEVKSGLASTVVLKYEQIPYYLGRYVKAGSDLVEDSFVGKSKDGMNVRIKPFIVTKMNTSKLVLSLIRKKTQELVLNELSQKTYDEFISAIVNARVQMTFRTELKKISPLKAFEFKRIELVK